MNHTILGPEEPDTIPRLRPVYYSWAIVKI